MCAKIDDFSDQCASLRRAKIDDRFLVIRLGWIIQILFYGKLFISSVESFDRKWEVGRVFQPSWDLAEIQKVAGSRQLCWLNRKIEHRVAGSRYGGAIGMDRLDDMILDHHLEDLCSLGSFFRSRQEQIFANLIEVFANKIVLKRILF